ncbi:hypothetical protein L2E82_49170 [Cichorium intybus]|uniref:Uncharacterized protein n=1 Tax=Cichorium intybus TaxID=13427 RepID=A0ACB8Z075_CICIN|nr:hypothetical protein L2E82_49170 [Cichorium intybus]
MIRGPPSFNTVEGNQVTQYPSRILFVAAKSGNTRFIIHLLKSYPDLALKVDDNGQTIFHIAVIHRHAEIYNLLYEIGSQKDFITPQKDKEGNNILHLVAKGATAERFQNVSGVALQMQHELLWFREVEQMIPPGYRQRKNNDGETPRGYDQNTGIPMFRQKAALMVFVIADAISLIFSSASVLTFLSIFTSRYAEIDFLEESLPKTLMFGLATLFISIVTMMITFSASFFVLYTKHSLWVPVMVTGFALMPLFLFASLQLRFIGDVFYATYRSKYLFKPKKRML